MQKKKIKIKKIFKEKWNDKKILNFKQQDNYHYNC